MNFVHSEDNVATPTHHDGEFVLDARAWNSIAARIMMSASSTSSSSVSGSGGGGGGGNTTIGENLAARGTARRGNLARSWNYDTPPGRRRSGRLPNGNDFEDEDGHVDENDRGDVERERVSLSFSGGMTRSKSTPSLRINEERSTEEGAHAAEYSDGTDGGTWNNRSNNRNHINSNNNRDKRSTSRRRQVLGSWLQSHAASATSPNSTDRDGDTASKSSWKSKLKSMRSKSTPRSRSRSSSQQQPQPQPQQSFGTRPRSNPTPFPRSAPLDTSHLKSRTAAPNSPTAAVSASSTQSRQPLIQKSKSAKSMSFHNNYQKHPSPGLTKAASFSNNNPNEKINNAIQTCQIHPEVRIRRNQCPLCAAEQTKKLRRSFHGSVRHRGSANDATAAAETAAPKNDCNDDDDGDGDDSNLKDGRPIDKVTVPGAAIHSAVARTTGSNPDLEFVDSSQVDIEVNSWNGGKRQQPQAQPQPPQQQQKSTCPWTQWSKHSANNDRNDSRHRDCDSNINGNDYTPNSNDDDAKKHDDDNESDTTSQESDRDRAGNVVDGIIHNFLEKMRLLSNQHGRQHQERQSGRDEVEEVEADDCLNDGNFENRGGDAEIDFYVGDGRRDDESDDVTDRRGDYTGYIHPQNESFENSNHYHGSRDECNDDENSLRGFHGHLSDHHIPYKYQHSFDDDAKVSNEGIWRSRPLEEESLPVLPVEHSREHKHSFYAEDPVSGEWKESKPFRSSLNGSELPKPQLQSHHSMDKDDDAIAKPSLKSSLTTLSELQKTILLATQSIGKFSPSEDEYDDRDFMGDDHHPVDEYHEGDDSDFLPVSGSGYDDDNDGILHRQYERISPSNSLEDNDRSYLPKGLHHHIYSHNKKNDENAIFDDEDCHSRESTDDEGSISSMARRGDQPAKRFAESKGSYMPANGVVPTSVAEEKNPYVRDALEDRSQFYQQRESLRTRQVLPQHERQEQEPSEPPLEVDCDSNSSGSSVTMDEFSSSRSLSSKSSSIAQEKRVRDVNRLDPIGSKENEAEKDSGHAKEMKHLPENRVSFTLEDEAGFPEVAGDVPEYDSERLIPKPKNAEENISPCTVILNDDNSEVQLPFGPPFSKVESKPETESFRGNKDSEVGDQPTEVTENSKILVEEKSQMHSQRQGRPTKRSSLRSSSKENGRSRRSSSGTRVEAEGISGDAKFDETVVSRAASKSSHQPSFFSALVQNSRQARSHSKTRTRARSRSKSRTRKAAKVVSVEDPKHQAAGKQEEEVSTTVKIDDKENIKDIGVKEDVNLANAEAPQDQVPREKPSAKIIEPKTLDETPKKRKKSGTKPDPPRNIRGPIAHPYYKLGDVAREEDMIIFPKKNSRSRRRRRRRRRHRSKSRTASLSSSDSSSSSDSDSDSDNDSDDDNLDEREARRKHSIYMSIKELRHLDAAFVKRSDGTWTYAIVCDWIDDEVRFVVNGRGSTKSIPQNIWRSNVRRIKVLSQRSGDNFISKDSASRKKRTIGRGRSSTKSARAKGRMVSPSPTRRTSTMNYMPTIAEDKRYNHF